MPPIEKVMNTKQQSLLSIDNFDKIDAFKEELNDIATTLVIALCGKNYKRKYSRYV